MPRAYPVAENVAVADTRESLFDHERLHVYQVAVQLDGQMLTRLCMDRH